MKELIWKLYSNLRLISDHNLKRIKKILIFYDEFFDFKLKLTINKISFSFSIMIGTGLIWTNTYCSN
jgi:hypothetical protein